MLELRAARTRVIAAAVVTQFQTLVVAGYDQPTFWLHTAGTVLCARALARELGTNTENSFTAGLLHDIGQLILAAHFPEKYRCVMAYRAELRLPPDRSRARNSGLRSYSNRRGLAMRWNFLAEIVVAIASHHKPMDMPAGSLVDQVYLADVMTHALEFPGGNDDLVPRLSKVAWNRLGIVWTDFKRLLGEIDAQRDEADWIIN